MWDDVGIVRSAQSLQRAASKLRELENALSEAGVAGADRAFNLSWHDWINLTNLTSVSRVIAAAAMAREDSRGAHYREDHPRAGELDASTYTVVRCEGDTLAIEHEPVRFTRVRPGETLVDSRTPAAA